MIDNLSKLKIETFSLIPTHRIFSYNYKICLNFQSPGALFENNTIILNPKFKDNEGKKINDDDLKSILAHEILHDILQHLPRLKQFLGENCSKQDEILWNLACDDIVNRILGEIGKKKNIKLSFIEKFGVNLSKIYGEEMKKFPVEILYRFLKENTEILEIEVETLKMDNREVKVVTCEIIDKDTYDLIYDYNKLILSERDEYGKIKTTDFTGRYIYELEDNLKKYGIISDTLSSEIKIIKQPISLKNHLKNYLNIIKSGLDDITFLKYGKLNIIFPHSKLAYPNYISRKCNIIIGIDVSRSISDKNFAEFISIIYSNINFFEGIIYFCDTEIRKELKLREVDEIKLKSIYKELQKRPGYGRTLFDPVFEKAKEFPEIDLIMYFTDLLPFEWPERPKSKVLWIVEASIKTYNISPPFGKVIYY